MQGGISFGGWVKRQRKALDMTQSDLAGMVGCSLSAIRKVEADEYRPSKQIAQRLAECLGVEPDQRQAFTAFARLETQGHSSAARVREASTEPDHPSPAYPANLHTPLTPFIGREVEVAAVQELLLREDARLVTLTGPPGVGKTRLGLQVALGLTRHYGDGVFFVSLSPVRDPALVVPTIAGALGLQSSGGEAPAGQLADYLRDRQALLLLDNFEQVIDAATGVLDLLAQCPHIKVLITSREALSVRGEHRVTVLPLALPDPSKLPSPDALSAYPSMALFVERAREANPSFALTESNSAAVAEICARLDGLPLAIELVAARSGMLSPQALLARLGKRLDLLGDGPRDLPPRHQTLRNAIAWSYALLTPAEQAFFAQMAVFVGGCALQAAETILNYEAASIENPNTQRAPEIQNTLESLLRKSLLRQEVWGNGDDEPRFTMLETIREHALERFEEREDAKELRARHAAYFLALAEEAEAGLSGPGQGEWLRRLDREHSNMRAAIAWALDGGDAELAGRLAGALNRYWLMRGQWGEGRRWLAAALEGEMSANVRAKALSGAGRLALMEGDYAEARALQEQSLSLYRKLGDQRGVADALCLLGDLALAEGEHSLAATFLAESMALAEDLGDKSGLARALAALAQAASDQGEYGRAAALHSRSVALYRELGYKQGAAPLALDEPGQTAHQEDDLERAGALYMESMALYDELRGARAIAATLRDLAQMAQETGDLQRAQALYTESVSLFRKVGDKESVEGCLSALAGL